MAYPVVFTTGFNQAELSARNVYNMRVIITEIIYTLDETTSLASRAAAKLIGMRELWGQTA